MSPPGRLASGARVASTHLRLRSVGSRLLSTTVLGQLAVLVALGVAASHISSEEFAAYGSAFGLANMINSFNTLGVESQLSLIRESDVAALFRTGTTVLAASTLVGVLAGLAELHYSSHVGELILLGVTASAGLAAQQLLTFLSLRYERHQFLTRFRLVQGPSNAITILLCSLWLSPNAVGLLTAWILSILLGGVVGLVGWGRLPKQLGRASRADWSIAMRQLGPQPVGNLASGLSTQLPLICLPLLVSSHEAGAWALVARLLGGVVTASLATTVPLFYARGAALSRQRKWSDLTAWYVRWLKGLAATAVLVFTLACASLLVVAPHLGGAWAGVATIAPAACLFWSTQFVAVPLSHTLLMLGHIGSQVRWEVARAVSTAAALFVGAQIGNVAAIWMWVTVSILAYWLLIAAQWRQLAATSRLTQPAS